MRRRRIQPWYVSPFAYHRMEIPIDGKAEGSAPHCRPLVFGARWRQLGPFMTALSPERALSAKCSELAPAFYEDLYWHFSRKRYKKNLARAHVLSARSDPIPRVFTPAAMYAARTATNKNFGPIQNVEKNKILYN